MIKTNACGNIAFKQSLNDEERTNETEKKLNDFFLNIYAVGFSENGLIGNVMV